ncbi:hypothetical protein EJ05DRAFT_484317 [Pseudovirgaria hyperparasitica]|uniref:GST N-terminal domain-containing protein n=1 Tax=Pseudovirgaria hyperparasitica TaxID=470096 RepID=A0A6A6WEM8_9PEZI|nr:uncharacterized protein EJ05DRAFT_484317 [Pseudovirgaria hyperparasitica]KAF2760609.1 hypothetical protein EJ05DRAFT_484317 [Pseudovirgaria hyperparasitica]
MASQFVLYDLASPKPNRSWSLNTLKTRIALNYKGIDYETKWLEFQDIEPTLKAKGVQPNASGTAFTVPTITTPDGKTIMDSVAIATYLESEYSTPKYPALEIDTDRLAKVQAATSATFGPLFPVLAPLVFGELISPGSVEYVKAKYGGKLTTEVEDPEAVWESARPALTALASLLKEKEGPFFEGTTRSHADLPLVAMLHSFTRPKDKAAFDRLVNFDPAFKTLYDEYAPYTKRDD